MIKPIKTHFLIPAGQKIKKGESLNILIGIKNENSLPMKYTFRIFGDIGYGYREIFSCEKILEPGGNPHHYFNLPPELFSEEMWGEEIEEILLSTSENGAHQNLIIIT